MERNSFDVENLSRAELIELVRSASAPSGDDRIGAYARGARRFSALYDALPTGIVETDLNQQVVRCNAAFAAMVGLPHAEIVGRFGWEFFHSESPPPEPAAVAELLAGRRPSYSAARVLRAADGSALAVKLDWAVLGGDDGHAVELACVVTDVSVQAHATVELQQARERAEVLWQQAPIGIIETTPDGVITSANTALAAMLGYQIEELVGSRAEKFADPADASAITASMQGLLTGRNYSAERRYLAADGRWVRVHVSAGVLRDQTGAVARLTAFVVDMTEAHAQREALRLAIEHLTSAREELLERQLFTDAMLETIDVGIVSCGADGHNINRNGTERALLGLADQHAGAAPDAAAQLIDVLGAAGERLQPLDYPLARALRGETLPDTDFRIGPRGGPYRDTIIRGSRITATDSAVLGAVVAITDVTVERTLLRELATERARLTDAQRLGQLGSYSYDVASGQFILSAEMFRIWGVTPDVDLAAVHGRMIHPDDRPRVVAGWYTALADGGRHTVEYRIVRPDSSVRHLRVSMEVLLDQAGNAATVHGTHLDVTDLTVAQREAVKANSLFTAILTATPDVTFVTNLATGALVYGAPGKSILGIPSDRLEELGSNIITNLVHPDEQPRLRAANLAARDLADGEVLHLRYRARHTDGPWHWLDRRVTPFRRDETTGQVLEVLGVVRDVTDLYRAELALRDSEARFRALVTQVVDYAIIGLDPGGRIQSWNDGAERLKGYTAADAIGRDFAGFYTEADRLDGLPARMLDTARTQGRVQQHGWRVRQNGSTFWADVVIAPLHDERGALTGFVKVTRDLTAQHQLEQAQASLFATVSHDLRSPITAIKMYAELIAEVDGDTQARYAARIENRATHLAKLVDGLFDYAKLRTGDAAVSLQPLSLTWLATECADNLGPALGAHPVHVEASDLMAMADATAMNRILENLLTNAARYSPAGSQIAITCATSDDLVRLSVTDSGRGIAPEDLETVFTEFGRGRLAEDDGGTGLGLASVRHLATLQGGEVWITSELGHGTTVTVELARAATTPHFAPAAT